MAKRGKKSTSKKTATSKSGRKYARSKSSPTGWKVVHVREYDRTKPTRKGGPRDAAANFCSKTRKKKQMGPKRKRK